MKFKIDENLPIDLVDILREAQYDAMSVLEQNLSGRADIQKVSTCCVFWTIPTTDSSLNRPLIPEGIDH